AQGGDRCVLAAARGEPAAARRRNRRAGCRRADGKVPPSVPRNRVECAKPPAWTKQALQLPSTRPLSGVADRFRSDYSDHAAPGEDSLNDSCLLSIRLESGPTSALSHRNIPVSEEHRT